MTIEQIKKLADWKRVFNSRSIYADMLDGRRLRLIGVGAKFLTLISGNRIVKIQPNMIVDIVGL